MARQKWAALRDEHLAAIQMDPSALAHLDRERAAARTQMGLRQHTLAEIRKARALTQKSLAERLAIPQNNISRIEHQADLHLSTLAEYIRALGGRLELTAVFDNDQMPIGIGDLRGRDEPSAPSDPLHRSER